MADVTIDQQFVEYIVKSLVGNPDAVKVARTIDEKGVLLELTVAPDDLGRVIGKRGNTAQSIRTLLRALGTKNDARYNLKIVDVNESGERIERPAREERRDEPQTAAAEELSDAVGATTEEPAVADEPAASEGASRWAHLASKTTEEETPKTEPKEVEEESSTEEGSSVVEKTRKELEDLADLNI